MNEAILYALSEVAIALAGFSGVAAAFNLRGKNIWAATEIRILWFLIMDSFFVLLFSFLPIPLYLSGWSVDILWAVCSALLGTWFIIGNLFAFQGERRDRASRKLTTAPVVTPILYGVLAIALIMGIALWLSAFNFIVPRGQAIYVAGLVALVGFAAVEFLFFIDLASRRKTTDNSEGMDF